VVVDDDVAVVDDNPSKFIPPGKGENIEPVLPILRFLLLLLLLLPLLFRPNVNKFNRVDDGT